MPSLNDLLMEVAAEGSATYMTGSGKAVGASSFSINSATGWPTTTGFIVAIRQVDTSGNEIANTYTEWIATLSGTTVTLGSGPSPVIGSDQVYPAGTTTQVYVPVSSTRDNSLIQALLVQHTQAGAHTGLTNTGGMTTDTLTITSNNQITAANLATSAITLATVSTSSAQSGLTSSPTLVTNLTATVTIPAGGRRVRVEALVPGCSMSGGAGGITLYLYNSATVTGTPLQDTEIYVPSPNVQNPMLAWYEYTPSAGSQSWCAAVAFTAGGGSTLTNANTVAFLTIKNV